MDRSWKSFHSCNNHGWLFPQNDVKQPPVIDLSCSDDDEKEVSVFSPLLPRPPLLKTSNFILRDSGKILFSRKQDACTQTLSHYQSQRNAAVQVDFMYSRTQDRATQTEVIEDIKPIIKKTDSATFWIKDEKPEMSQPGPWDPMRFSRRRENRMNPTKIDTGTMRKNNCGNCWNCGSSAHVYTTCPKPLAMFCHSCGERGFTSKTCPKCTDRWSARNSIRPSLERLTYLKLEKKKNCGKWLPG